MSREYNIENTLLIWDFILSGVKVTEESLKDEEEFLFREPASDPFINLEFVSCAMIILIKEELMENDFSACLGILMSYKEPDSPIGIIGKASKIREAILHKKKYEREPSPIAQDEEEPEDNYQADFSMKPQLANATNNIVTSNERKAQLDGQEDNNDGTY